MKKLFVMGKDSVTIMTFTGELAQALLDQVVMRSEDFVPQESRIKGTLELKCIRENTFSIHNDSARIHMRLDNVVRYTVTP